MCEQQRPKAVGLQNRQRARLQRLVQAESIAAAARHTHPFSAISRLGGNNSKILQLVKGVSQADSKYASIMNLAKSIDWKLALNPFL